MGHPSLKKKQRMTILNYAATPAAWYHWPPSYTTLTTKQMLLKYLLLEERVLYGGKKNDCFWVLANATRCPELFIICLAGMI
jgi:hypothetical protein